MTTIELEKRREDNRRICNQFCTVEPLIECNGHALCEHHADIDNMLVKSIQNIMPVISYQVTISIADGDEVKTFPELHDADAYAREWMRGFQNFERVTFHTQASDNFMMLWKTSKGHAVHIEKIIQPRKFTDYIHALDHKTDDIAVFTVYDINVAREMEESINEERYKHLATFGNCDGIYSVIYGSRSSQLFEY